MSQDAKAVRPKKATTPAVHKGFQYFSYPKKQRYPVQFNADFGVEPGPWIAINFQSHVFVAGWLPKKRRF